MKVSFEGLGNATTSTQLPVGQYEMNIDAVDAEYESQEKGSKALEVKVHIEGGMDFDDGTSTVGLQRTLRFWYPTPSQKDGGKFCKGRLNEFVQACGLDTEDDSFDTDDLVGASFRCRCRIKTDAENRVSEEYDRFKNA